MTRQLTSLPILVLLGLSCWMWLLILVKIWQFWQLHRSELPLDDCLARFGRGEACPGWQGELLRLFRQRTAPALPGEGVLQGLGQQLAAEASRSIDTILTLAQVAPLLGLIGTVAGMVDSFAVLSRQGAGDLGALSGGISNALFSTQAGLVVAIPGLFLGSLLRRRGQRLETRMEAFAIAAGRELLPCGQVPA